ncbi:hypothetical protein PAXINDRAFT_14330 [Paxillus involutus ATCC 200175]|uniref:DUF4939 domain-containing protein n=1 Tax=Paxillus involutus ATCC 200175 TaxID=664439 RepID=A0A0C9TZ05_PAXIN|nr:hypothetical protein PAXINDRAFT_14330 [Paxillus involutus ATCC 200175]
MSRTVQTWARAHTVQNIIAPPTDSAQDDALSSLYRDSTSQVRFPPHTPSTPTPSACQPRHGGDEPDPPDHGDGGGDDPDEDPDNNNDGNNDDKDVNIFGNPPDPNDLPANPIMALAEAIHGLARLSHRDPDTDNSSSHMKVWEPDTFNGTEPCKLRAFLVQYELNFQNCLHTFQMDQAKVTFAQSYLKGMALEWFEPDLLQLGDPALCPDWMDDYREFVLELQTNFGPHDPVGDAEHQLDHLSMKDGQHINKIKDKISRIGKPRTLGELRTLSQTIDGRYWERKSKVARQTKISGTQPSMSKGNSNTMSSKPAQSSANPSTPNASSSSSKGNPSLLTRNPNLTYPANSGRMDA